MKNLNLLKVSFNGATEHNSIDEVVRFLKNNPLAEVGIDFTDLKGIFGTPRYFFIKGLTQRLDKSNVQSGFYINISNDWFNEIIRDGKLPEELHYFSQISPQKVKMHINLINQNHNIDDPSMTKFCNLAERYSKKIRFVVRCNRQSLGYIIMMATATKNFDVMFEYNNKPQEPKQCALIMSGNIIKMCEGGFNLQNIGTQLDKINQSQKSRINLFLSAENEFYDRASRKLNLNNAELLINKIKQWELHQNSSRDCEIVKSV